MEAAAQQWCFKQVNVSQARFDHHIPLVFCSCLSRKLLVALWAGREADAQHLELLCVKFGLFIPLNPLDEVQLSSKEEKFLVPSLLPLKDLTEPAEVVASSVEPLTCYFLFSTDSNLMRQSASSSTRLCDCNFRFLPTGLFAHVIGQAILLHFDV
jgi:hypothetical protein